MIRRNRREPGDTAPYFPPGGNRAAFGVGCVRRVRAGRLRLARLELCPRTSQQTVALLFRFQRCSQVVLRPVLRLRRPRVEPCSQVA